MHVSANENSSSRVQGWWWDQSPCRMSACLWQVPSKPIPGDGAISLGWSHIPEVGAKSLAVGPHPWGGGAMPLGVRVTSLGVEPHQGGGAPSRGWGHVTMSGATSLGVESHHGGWSHITGGGASSLGSSHVTAGEATSRGWGHSTCGGATSLRVGPRHWGGATSLGCGHVTKCGQVTGGGPTSLGWSHLTGGASSSLETPTEGKQELPLCGVCQRPFQHCLLSASS